MLSESAERTRLLVGLVRELLLRSVRAEVTGSDAAFAGLECWMLVVDSALLLSAFSFSP